MLPRFNELHRWHVMEAVFCPLCVHDNEDLFHCLMQCDHAKSLWETVVRSFDIKQPKLNQLTWASDVLDPQLVQKQEVAAMITLTWVPMSDRSP